MDYKSWNLLCITVAFTALFSLRQADARVAVEYCMKCPANSRDGTLIERDCAGDMDDSTSGLEFSEDEKCVDNECYIKVTGEEVERGCAKDFKPEGQDTGPCDPMQLYLLESHKEPMYCKCSQRKHCNDLDSQLWAKDPVSAARSRHVKSRGGAPSIESPGFARVTLLSVAISGTILGLAIM